MELKIGYKLEIVEQKDIKNKCKGCVFNNIADACGIDMPCDSENRKDNKHIIFKLIK